ncbi:GNAT family N-acetyltransferase [Thalassobaculum sp.]|uniref:GNAT family N-acetyltransferase n=1 Tax=Thalassobaculum sp. TaxID=2022740 RepID=UPI0032EF9BB9
MQKATFISAHIIRHARPADIPAIRTMQERSMRVLGSEFYTSNEINNFLNLFGTMDDIVVDEGHYFVAEDHRGTILGSGGWSRSRPGYAKPAAAIESPANPPTVRSMFVDPAFTRRGIATAIMARTERDALEQGIDTLHLTATLSGLALYEAFGYHTEQTTALQFPDMSSFACVKMRKSLASPQIRTA